MTNPITNYLKADCQNCFGLCCVALPYGKSADFAFDKAGGTPCRNLQSNFQCSIHKDLRNKGFRGCSAFECFGAGQKVSQFTYKGNDWRTDTKLSNEMFQVFPIIQQLHEMLWYLNDALNHNAAETIHHELWKSFEETDQLTKLHAEEILEINVHEHRAKINQLLIRTSELVRTKTLNKKYKINNRRDLIGAKLQGVDLAGANLRGVLLIAADLRNADLQKADFIGADLRDADISGANLTGCIFLTQAQVNAAKGDKNTKLPSSLSIPSHWKQVKKNILIERIRIPLFVTN
ncbi:pentapeptide repeat-containing protein [Bacillus sp. FJAT-49736]|uniref:pentapeptide repeat-containing protein n=1 Tax=Bacillus sp. FJAT-49736 TaxID=2833582 RepID=UPI001BC995A1|nr:pentapeptide repeat-containing protein [Bacillus sp. FJAT-49736]MBS4172688.1 pentapeptide repeat-containing protein [Bacillus sp. FJAT-49736]